MLKFKKVRDVKSPTRGTVGSAGIDFYVPNTYTNDNTVEVCIMPGESVNFPSGIIMDIPEHHALIAFNKSGIATNKDLIVGACVVDSDYQGEIHLHVMNVGKDVQFIRCGEKLIQFILIPINMAPLQEVTGNLFTTETGRGTGGFGSTGAG